MLTYCTNIHPGEAWQDVRRNLDSHLLEVKRSVSPHDPFPIGLRLSARAAGELDEREERRFSDWCAEQSCFVLSVNGFPYGPFHGSSVKRSVYLPDWRQRERVAYTERLADLLAGWLPEGVVGSISTAPVAFAAGFGDADWPLVRRHVVEVASHLDRIRQSGGPTIVLAFEPEPRCVLETSAQAVAFFDRLALPPALADLVGICFDCCHQAVEFEEPLEGLTQLRAAGVRIGKVQISSALRVLPHELDALESFDEPTYLHQVVARWQGGPTTRYDDLPHFLAELAHDPGGRRRASLDECRVHYHVPIFAEHLGRCGTTRFFLEQLLPQLSRLTPDAALEVETYSWAVLPDELTSPRVAMDVVRELEWARLHLGELGHPARAAVAGKRPGEAAGQGR